MDFGVGMGSCVVKEVGDVSRCVFCCDGLFGRYFVESYEHRAIDCSSVVQKCAYHLLHPSEFGRWEKWKVDVGCCILDLGAISVL